jgi:hypothetical protein
MPRQSEKPVHLIGEVGIYTVTDLESRRGHWFALGVARCCGKDFARRVDRLRVDDVCWICDRTGKKRGEYRPAAQPWPTPKVELLRHRAIMSKPFGAI